MLTAEQRQSLEQEAIKTGEEIAQSTTWTDDTTTTLYWRRLSS